VANADWNGALAADGQVTFGFTGTWTGTNDAPDDFRLDGQPCTGPDEAQGAASSPAATSAVANEGPLTGGLYTDPTTQAAAAWQLATGADKDLLAAIALTPQATWVGDWAPADTAASRVRDVTSAAFARGETATLVVYAIPGRDCGAHSAGGVATSEYARWVDRVAAGVVGSPIVVLEPDALAQLGDCEGQGDRVGYLRHAAHVLTAAGGRVYLDVGNSAWLSPAAAAERLQQVGFDDAVGFALNTSNYQTTADSRAYGEQVSALVGGKGFVVDTSRNGNGSNGEWCNPRGRALGDAPTLVSDDTHLDALLWVKAPGESDGTCNGGPAAGTWWQDMALELARNAQR
jgi:endoglucanase